jgi:hypothetical protein
MARGETTQRSDVNPATLIARLQARCVAQLTGADAIWVALDGSDLRKPHAWEMAHLQRVRSLDGGLVPGYRTLNALGIGGHGRRGLLYHRPFSSAAPDFVSESREIQSALDAVGQALAPLAGCVSGGDGARRRDPGTWPVAAPGRGSAWPTTHWLTYVRMSE